MDFVEDSQSVFFFKEINYKLLNLLIVIQNKSCLTKQCYTINENILPVSISSKYRSGSLDMRERKSSLEIINIKTITINITKEKK